MSLNNSSPYTCPSKLVQVHSDYSRNSDSANEAFSMYRSSARARSNSLSSNAESFVSNGGSVSSSNSAAAPFVWMTVLRSRPGLAEELTTFLAGASQRILGKEPGVLFHRTLRCVDDEDDDVVGTRFLAYAEFMDDDAFDLHLQSEEFQLLVENSDLIQSAPEVFFFKDAIIPASE